MIWRVHSPTGLFDSAWGGRGAQRDECSLLAMLEGGEHGDDQLAALPAQRRRFEPVPRVLPRKALWRRGLRRRPQCCRRLTTGVAGGRVAPVFPTLTPRSLGAALCVPVAVVNDYVCRDTQ